MVCSSRTKTAPTVARVELLSLSKACRFHWEQRTQSVLRELPDNIFAVFTEFGNVAAMGKLHTYELKTLTDLRKSYEHVVSKLCIRSSSMPSDDTALLNISGDQKA